MLPRNETMLTRGICTGAVAIAVLWAVGGCGGQSAGPAGLPPEPKDAAVHERADASVDPVADAGEGAEPEGGAVPEVAGFSPPEPPPLVEPEVPADCVVELEGADVLPFLARYQEKLCTWLEPGERKQLARVDLSGTGAGDAEALALVVVDVALRELVPKALVRSRERELKSYARQLRRSAVGEASKGGWVLSVCYGGPLGQACEFGPGWESKRCKTAQRHLEPLRLLCGSLNAERLIWVGVGEVGEETGRPATRDPFAALFTAMVEAKVPRRQVVRFAIGLLEDLAQRAREHSAAKE